MSKKKKLTAEEREQMGQEIVTSLKYYKDNDIDILEELLGPSIGPSKKPRNLSKNTLQKLRKYNILVEASVFWASRQAYLELLKSFLSKEIDGVIFSSKFFRLRGQNMARVDEICEKIEESTEPIPDLYYTAKAADFNSAIDALFFIVEPFDPDIKENEDNLNLNDVIYGEKTLRLSLQRRILPRLEKSCDLDDSSFEPKINLDRLVQRSYSIFFSVLAASGLLLVNFF